MTSRSKKSVMLMIGLGVSISIFAWTSDNQVETKKTYQTATVSLGTITEMVVATGVIRPMVGAEINVGSRISGTVVKLPVEVGDSVEVGQLLAKLDATALQASVDQRLADVELAKPKVLLAESMLKRSQQLAARNLVSAADLDIARRDLAVERAQLKASEARLRSANIQLGYTQIIAPIKGVVAEVSTRKGETVAANFSAPTFVTILNLDRLEVLAYVDETDIGLIQVGQKASFTVDTYPNQEFKATINAIHPRAEIQGSVVNYVVRLDLETSDTSINKTFILRPEMTAHVRLMVAKRNDVIKVSRNTIKRKGGRQFVLLQKNGQWIEQSVRTGWRSESEVEIVSGVNAGAILAINSNNKES